MTAIGTIVVAYDDSEQSRRALDRAATLAKALAARLVVTTVAPVTASTGHSLGADPVEGAAEHRSELAAARAFLNGEGLSADYVEALGHPAAGIVAAAEEQSADLIVLGARDLSHVQRLLGQSVSDAVSHGARCDVLLVH